MNLQEKVTMVLKHSLRLFLLSLFFSPWLPSLPLISDCLCGQKSQGLPGVLLPLSQDGFLFAWSSELRGILWEIRIRKRWVQTGFLVSLFQETLTISTSVNWRRKVQKTSWLTRSYLDDLGLEKPGRRGIFPKLNTNVHWGQLGS